MFKTVATVVLASAGFTAHAQYTPYGPDKTDTFNFTTADRSVQATGTVQWQKGRIANRPDTMRGVLGTGSTVTLLRRGCAHVRVKWHLIAMNDVSWPPSGGMQSVSDGYYVQCGAAGTRIPISGMNYVSARLTAATVSVGWSGGPNQPRRYDANHRMSVGGR